MSTSLNNREHCLILRRGSIVIRALFVFKHASDVPLSEIAAYGVSGASNEKSGFLQLKKSSLKQEFKFFFCF